MNLPTKTKTCSRCGEPKSLDDFKSDSRKPDGKASSCKACNAVPKVGGLPIASSRALVPVFDVLDPQAWIDRIAKRWRDSVEAIIDVGRLLLEAKAALPHGGWGSVVAGLPFGERQIQMLVAIAADPRLSNPQCIALLPASWGTLYDLTRLSDGEFDSAVKQQIIRPDMLRADAKYIRPLTRGGQHSSDESGSRVEDNPQGEGTGAASVANPGAASDPGSHAAPDPSEAILPNGARAIMGSRVEPSDSLDYFPTPPWATRALIERVFDDRGLGLPAGPVLKTVWEPFCGEGHIAEVLWEYGCEVFASDIFDYGYGDALIDFLCDPPTIAPEVDWIISNSPFGDKCETSVLYALQRARVGVAMFVPLRWLETIGRYERVFRDQPPTLIAFFAERVNLCKGRWEPDGSTATAYIWLVWIHGAEPRAPFWIPPGCREALTRSDDAERFTQHPVKKREDNPHAIT